MAPPLSTHQQIPAPNSAPPPMTAVTLCHPPDELTPPKADFTAPPPYESQDYTTVPQVPSPMVQQSKLPTYEEVQLEKSLHGELPVHTQQMIQPPPSICQTGRPNGTGAVTFIAIDASDADNLATDNSLLGTDIMFITAFLIAFLFNWIGFLMLTCFCHTIAARYGALSGFGLSLAKWTLIVKHSTDLASHENSWLWWLIMAFGFLICVRALVQYISIKRTWRLLSASAQERLLFFY